MGYTHYWRNEGDIDYEAWEHRYEEARALVATLGDRYEIEDVDLVDQIFFNGACETFRVPEKPGLVPDFEFCKTRQERYDDLIVACLCLLAEAGLNVTSDGDFYDWVDGAKLASEFVGRTVSVPSTVTRGVSE